MIIVLKGADFSANNIGHIEVTKYLAPFTLAAIEASGNTSLRAEQKSALNTFFDNLGAFDNTGLWTKIKVLMMPMLSLDLAHSMVDYTDNEVKVVPNSTYYEQVQDGLHGIATEGNFVANACQFESNKAVSSSNYSVVLLGTPGNVFTDLGYINGSLDTIFTGSKTGAGGRNFLISNHGTQILSVNAQKVIVEKSIGFSSGASATDVNLYSDGFARSSTLSAQPKFAATPDGKIRYSFMRNSSGTALATDGTLKVAIIGDSLTPDELKSLCDYVDIFNDAFVE